jgi:serine/threonine-protein kinase
MPTMSLRPGEIFAGYSIERELGTGGMGSVYLAHHPRLPRFDALKLLRPELCADPAFVGRFEREADTVAQLDHPNIIAVHDRGSHRGQLWMTMQFIDGANAEKALADYDNGMPPDRAVRIVGKVASALDYAHRHQLLHRDVKPANIMLTNGPDDDDEEERVFLSDFGVAKSIGEAAERISSLTSTGSVVATLDYASPEQIKGLMLGEYSDIYALGCVLYKLLTGTVPFPGDSVAARVYGHLNGTAVPPSTLIPGLPAGFDDVLARALAKEPADRYPTCRALAIAARNALVGPDEAWAASRHGRSALQPGDQGFGSFNALPGSPPGPAVAPPPGTNAGRPPPAARDDARAAPSMAQWLGQSEMTRNAAGTRPESVAGPGDQALWSPPGAPAGPPPQRAVPRAATVGPPAAAAPGRDHAGRRALIGAAIVIAVLLAVVAALLITR